MCARSLTARFEYSTLMPAEAGEGCLDLLVGRSFLGQPFVDRGQFLRRRVVFGAGEFCLDFERNLRQLLLPVLRPGRDPFQYRLNLILGHAAFYPIAPQRASTLDVAFG